VLFPASLALTVVVAIFYLLEVALGGPGDRVLHRLGALRHDLVVDRGEYYRVFCAAFLHGGALHLVMNGLALVQLAPLVELVWGGSRLLVVYLLSALGGTVLSAWLQPMPSVGASGAILGLAGLLLGATWFGREPSRSRLRELLGRRLLFGVALTFVVGVALSVLWLPIVDNYGHLGGFAAGVGASAFMRDPQRPPGRASRALAALLCALFLLAFGWMAVSGRAADSIEDRVAEHQLLMRAAPHHPRTELRTYELAQELAVEGRHDVARALLLGRLQVAPGDEVALAHLARSFRLHGGVAPDLLGAARAHVERALAGPDGSKTRLLAIAADLHAMAGDLGAATRAEDELLALQESALRMSPDDPGVLNDLAWALLTRHDPARRDPARAHTLARRAVDRLEGSFTPFGEARVALAHTRDTLAEALFQLGRLDEALETQRRAVELGQAEGLVGDDLLDLTRRLETIEAARRP
jgi:rhomboid protease GluP